MSALPGRDGGAGGGSAIAWRQWIVSGRACGACALSETWASLNPAFLTSHVYVPHLRPIYLPRSSWACRRTRVPPDIPGQGTRPSTGPGRTAEEGDRLARCR